MDRKHKGAYAELKACSWLFEQGYEVFRNVSPFGTVDIIAVDKYGQHVFIDVKTLTEKQLKYGVPKSKTGLANVLVYISDKNTFFPTWKVL